MRSVACKCSLFLALLCAGFFSSAARAGEAQREVLTSAAISLKEVMNDLGKEFQAANPNIKVTLNLGASGQLELQIKQGAPADFYVGAAPQNVRRLAEGGFVTTASMRTFCRNQLTLLARRDALKALTPETGKTTASLLAGAAIKKIAIGNPKTVPAGQYAEKWLRANHLWNALQPKLIMAENVRQALTWVESGDVDAALVYASDALTAKHARPAQTIAAGELKIEYALALTKQGENNPAARKFYEFVNGPAGRKALLKHGFLPAKP